MHRIELYPAKKCQGSALRCPLRCHTDLTVLQLAVGTACSAHVRRHFLLRRPHLTALLQQPNPSSLPAPFRRGHRGSGSCDLFAQKTYNPKDLLQQIHRQSYSHTLASYPTPEPLQRCTCTDRAELLPTAAMLSAAEIQNEPQGDTCSTELNTPSSGSSPRNSGLSQAENVDPLKRLLRNNRYANLGAAYWWLADVLHAAVLL